MDKVDVFAEITELEDPEIGPDYRRPKLEDNVWPRFCFLDESGSLNDSQSQFFTVGYIKITNPGFLMREINRERRRKGFWDEMKFNKLSRLNLPFAKFAIDSVFTARNFNFVSYTLDKQGEFFRNSYGGDPWRAYEDITVQLVRSTTGPSEVLAILADHVDTPNYVHYETSVRKLVNDASGEQIVHGVVRLDSKCNELLQLADLLIGCINYDLKIASGVAEAVSPAKAELMNYFKSKLGASDFMSGYKKSPFNIFVDKDIKLRKPNSP